MNSAFTRLFFLGTFLFTGLSQAAIQLNLEVTPERSEDVTESMNCKLTLSRGRQNPVATLENIKSDLVSVETVAKGYRVVDGTSRYVEKSHSSEVSLDYDYFVKQVQAVSTAQVKGDRDDGPVGPVVRYSGKISGKTFLLSETSERGFITNTSKDRDMLVRIIRRACYR